MATPDCDNGVTVDLEDGGGGGVDQNRRRASGPLPTTIVSYLLLYYSFFMFYVIGFSKTWWHAALGIVVPPAFLVMSLFLDCPSPRELMQLKIKDDSRHCLRLMTLLLYYVLFIFYLVGSSEYWWHAALGIVLVTGFVMLSYLLYALLPGGVDVKPPDSDVSDLSTTLLGPNARN